MLHARLLRRISILALVALAVGAAHADTDSALPRLEVVARYSLTLDGDVPFDVRWAGPDSVYVAYAKSGVFELELREGLPVRRQVFPDVQTLGFHQAPVLSNLAASGDWLVVSAIGRQIAWRQPPDGSDQLRFRTETGRATYLDLDVDHDRVAVLGVPDFHEYPDHPGAIVWLGEIDDDSLGEWRPVWESEAVAEDFDVIYDRALFKGSVRFLDDGGFLVAPGFVSGLLRFSKTGKLKERWTAEDLWGDGDSTEWAEVDPDGAREEKIGAQLRTLRARHVIDEVLPHPDGPAILVRSPDRRERRYRLGVLGAENRWYDLPDVGVDRHGALRADVDDDGRIVILGTTRSSLKPARISTTELLVLELPVNGPQP